ncbi:hypothetical protein AVEN_150194-1 [Araneus ventricosus]|uniref:Uncharacterized protein n=1 Tax=Araneus ventricosus TaxID=182803 RepID=A0A4Y2X5C2_ARAVE|nr:hypothetical protein AVEN_150194-1 [Araneus ventricosus]
MLVPSLRAITICPLLNSPRSAAFPITGKIKCKNDYLPSPEAVKYHSHLTTSPPCHSDEFMEKCGDGHSVLARQCISCIVDNVSGNLIILGTQGIKVSC